MRFTSKKTSLVILGIASVVCSRTIFALINDPEGPNLLVVIAMAAILYFLSLAVGLLLPLTGLKRLLFGVAAQILIATGFFLFLK
jgi:hypothetical protein